MDAKETGLAAAITAAMAQTAPQADALVKRLKAVADLLAAAAPEPQRRKPLRRREAESLAALEALERDTAQRLADALDEISGRLGAAAERFNIVLFGRTGSGKSTLIEALTRGDGASISDGRADHTQTVRRVLWNDCALHDTPGTLGAGRAEADTATLERRAHEAVIVADVVLLCFDSQNQLEGEFDQVAEWIAAYEKPAVAVLNVRTPAWRATARVPRAADRRHLSAAVAQHAARIRGELAATGLPGVPVVALNSKNAVFARAGTRYAGPNPESRKGMTAAHGEAEVERWSNLPALEALLTQAIDADAASLRLGMLRKQVRHTLDKAAGVLDAEIIAPAQATAGHLERAVDECLEVLGSPTESRTPALLATLQRLAELRGGTEPPPGVPGRVGAFAQSRLDIALGSLQREAQQRAYRLVRDALERGEDVDAAAFEREVYGPLDTDAVFRDLQTDIKAFLDDNLETVAQELRTDLEFTRRALELQGRAGKGLLLAGSVTGVIGTSALVGGLTAALAALSAAVPIALPITLLLGGVASRIISAVLKRIGRRRREARTGDLLTRATANVDGTFAELGREIRTRIGELLDRVRDNAVTPLAATAIAHRELEARARRLRDRLHAERDDVPADTLAPQRLLTAAATAREHATGRTAAGLWLGEDWIGGDDADGAPIALTRTPRASALADWVRRFQTAPQFRAAQRHPRKGAGRTWLRAFANEPELADLHRDLTALLAATKPAVVLCGDYSTGKTSLVRRLLLETGRTPGDDLEVAARPQTGAVCEWDLGDLTLVDTPGLRAGTATRTAAAFAAVRRATLVLYLLNPTFAHAEGTDLDLVLGTPGPEAAPGRADRVLFVLGRADEIGPDPYYAEREFQAAVQRKRTHLLDLLRARGHTIPPERVHYAIAAPSGVLLTRPEETAPYREWDGIADLHRTLRAAAAVLSRNAPDAAVLHTGHQTLTELQARNETQRATAEREAAQLALLETALRQQTTVARLLRRARVEVLRSAVRHHLEAEFDRLRDLPVADARRAAAEYADWPRTDTVQDLVQRWLDETDDQVAQWNRQSDAEVRAQFARAAFKDALPDAVMPASLDGLKWGRGRGPIGAVGKLLRDPVVGTLVGGLVGTVALGVVEAVESRVERRRAVKLEPRFDAARADLAAAADQWVADLIDPTATEPGPAAALIAELDRNTAALDAYADDLRGRRREALAAADRAAALRARCDDLIAKARKALSVPKTVRTQGVT